MAPVWGIEGVLPRFGLPAEGAAFRRLLGGRINETWLAALKTGERYVLQRVNTGVFRDPRRVMENIALVTEQIRTRLLRETGDPDRRVLTFLPSREGPPYWESRELGFWRVCRYVEDSVSRALPAEKETLEQAGQAFGEFQYWLSGLDPASLFETVPGFHHTAARMSALREAASGDPLGRGKGVRRETDFLLAREGDAGLLTDALRAGRIPLRVTHNDTKLSNVLFDRRSGRALCVIDLDTVMPGSALFDFGDGVRGSARGAAEGTLDPRRYRAFARGFLRGARGTLTEAETALMPDSVRIMAMELAARYLTDYLTGDGYFRPETPDRNLERARDQIALVRDTEEKLDALREETERCLEETR